MTCVAAVVEDGKVWMGADSAGVRSDYEYTRRKDPKVGIIQDEYIIGFTSSFRMGQILLYDMTVPSYEEGTDVYRHMVTKFIKSVRNSLQSGGYTHVSQNKETGGIFLVGFRGRLFKVESDFQIGESIDNYMACGCGEPYATGAMYVSKHLRAVDRIKTALEAAEYHNAGIRAPFNIMSL